MNTLFEGCFVNAYGMPKHLGSQRPFLLNP
jgi:hypothetical protein